MEDQCQLLQRSVGQFGVRVGGEGQVHIDSKLDDIEIWQFSHSGHPHILIKIFTKHPSKFNHYYLPDNPQRKYLDQLTSHYQQWSIRVIGPADKPGKIEWG